MNLRCKKPRPLTREQKTFRDDRLFIIATEDTHAPRQYFRFFKESRIKVHILETQEGLSAPKHVLRRLDGFIEEYNLHEEDRLWLMLDTDHWTESNHIRNFDRVCTEAIQKGYKLAHSNPCFEVWLLLHFTDLAADDQFEVCSQVTQHLKNNAPEYHERGLDPTLFSPAFIQTAIQRAEALDSSQGDRWPQKTGTHVYRVVKELYSSIQCNAADRFALSRVEPS